MEIAVDARAELGEGPWWDAASQELLWVDIEGRRFHRYRPEDGSSDGTDMPGRVATVVSRAGGGWLFAMEHAFAVTDPGSDELRVIAEVEPDLNTRMNDGLCDRHGRLFAGTMDLAEEAPIGALYRLDPDGAVERVIESVGCSNGLDWNLAGDQMYYIDSNAYSIDVLDFDEVTGRVSGRRPLVHFREDEGAPDGLTVDAEGFIWVALWGGSSVRRYSPQGELERVLGIEAEQVTKPCFGGVDLDELYITSARVGLSAFALSEQRHAGAVMVHRPGVTGRVQHPFAG